MSTTIALHLEISSLPWKLVSSLLEPCSEMTHVILQVKMTRISIAWISEIAYFKLGIFFEQTRVVANESWILGTIKKNDDQQQFLQSEFRQHLHIPYKQLNQYLSCAVYEGGGLAVNGKT